MPTCGTRPGGSGRTWCVTATPTTAFLGMGRVRPLTAQIVLRPDPRGRPAAQVPGAVVDLPGGQEAETGQATVATNAAAARGLGCCWHLHDQGRGVRPSASRMTVTFNDVEEKPLDPYRATSPTGT